MPIGLLNLEWANLNAARHWPLTDDASTADITGSFRLPNSFLTGLDLPVHDGVDVDPSRFFINRIDVYASGFLVGVGYQPASGDPVAVATALIGTATHVPGTLYALGGLGDYADTFGKITVGRLDEINAQPSGSFTFDLTGARIEPDCVRPIIRGLSSISVVSGTERSDRIYGDIELVADSNVQLVPVIVSGQDPRILISAIQGEGLAEACVCIGDENAPPIRRINNVPPTPTGDMTFIGTSCMEISPITNGLKFADICSTPCCGCQELEVITTALAQFGDKAATLEGFLNRLESEVTSFSDVVLGSRLSDVGCVSS